MQTFTFTAFIASLAALSSAAPPEKRQIKSVPITFYTPEGEKWSQAFPTDMTPQEVGMCLRRLLRYCWSS